MKRFASKVFSKLVIGALIIILQFGWFVYLIYSATAANSAVNMCLQIVAVALALYIANNDFRMSGIFYFWTFGNYETHAQKDGMCGR